MDHEHADQVVHKTKREAEAAEAAGPDEPPRQPGRTSRRGPDAV